MAKGDHIYVECFPHDHHGIDCGDGTIIHYSSKFTIMRTSKSKFADRKTIKRKNYTPKYFPDVIVKRAEKRLGERKYDLLSNNCENFAYDCTSGEPDSWQVYQAGVAAGAGAGAGVGVAVVAPVMTTVSAGGVLGWLGMTTAAVALGPTIAVAALAGVTVAGAGYLAASAISKLDDTDARAGYLAASATSKLDGTEH